MPAQSSRRPVRPTVDVSKGFFRLVPEAFGYPVRGQGKYLLIVGALFFGLLTLFSMVPLFGLVAAIFGAGYLSAFLFDIAATSARGDADLPGWPDYRDFTDDILMPLLWWIAALAVCMLPAAVAGLAHLLEYLSSPVLPLVLAAGGLAALPMALLAVALSGSVSALNPVVIVASIFKVPAQYGVLCLVLALILAARQLLDMSPLPSLPIVGEVISLYFAVVEMRLLGLLYYTNEKRLAWFEIS